jgi:hypothetical protein
MNGWCGFIAIMFEVTVSLIILSLEAMKALCHPYWSWLKGFHSVQIGWLSPRFLITIPSHLLLWGLLGLKHFVSLCIVHLGMGSFMLLVFAQGVMIVIMPKGLLKVDFFFSALFYLNILQLIGKTMRVIPCVF